MSLVLSRFEALLQHLVVEIENSNFERSYIVVNMWPVDTVYINTVAAHCSTLQKLLLWLLENKSIQGTGDFSKLQSFMMDIQ